MRTICGHASRGGEGEGHLQDEKASRRGASKEGNSFDGVFLLLLLNVAIFIADHVLKLPVVFQLYLTCSDPRWYQFVTSIFCHSGWEHLSANLFFVYIFGKLVEEEEGSVGLLVSYLVTGIGANIVSWLLLPRNTICVGASGAVFGLYVISVLLKLRWNWRNLLEVIILGQYVVEKLLVEAKSSVVLVGTRINSTGINHVAHFAAALVGAALVLFLRGIPEPKSETPKLHPE